ncbi:MAG: hypothetical protein JSS27_18875 [Planctomycetes bacterium]|nr:hypothetical protein [Planctomycetota bacterium]
MARGPTIIKTVGLPGAGKTFRRAALFLSKEFLPNATGTHWSNFPIKKQVIADYVAKRTGQEASTFFQRMKLIDQGALDSWAAGQSGPWDYFANVSLEGAHIAIDEAHNFCGEKMSSDHLKRWQDWLGEIRHRGASIEFLTQHEDKMARCVKQHCALTLEIISGEDRRDPFFKISLRDWYELRAVVFGNYLAGGAQLEWRDVGGKKTLNHAHPYWLSPEFFEMYDSYSAPVSGDASGAEPELHEFQRRSKLGVVWWFIRKNFFQLAPKLIFASAVLWATVGGGGVWAFQKVMLHVNQAMKLEAQQKTIAGGGKVAQPGSVGQPPAGVKLAMGDSISQEQLNAVRASTAELAKLRSRIAELEAVAHRASQLRILFPDAFGLADGSVYRLDEVIRDGVLKGRRANRIDWPNKLVFLDDGRVLGFLPVQLQERKTPGRGTDSGVPEALPGARDVGGDQRSGETKWTAAKPVVQQSGPGAGAPVDRK